MSVISDTTLYFFRREAFTPILNILVASKWTIRIPDRADQFIWFPPGMFGDDCDHDCDVQFLPQIRLNDILDKIRTHDEDLKFKGQLSLGLVFPINNIETSEVIWTGGYFCMNYNPQTPYMSCLWEFNRLLVNNEKYETDFSSYRQFLKPLTDIYQDRIKNIEEVTN